MEWEAEALRIRLNFLDAQKVFVPANFSGVEVGQRQGASLAGPHGG